MLPGNKRVLGELEVCLSRRRNDDGINRGVLEDGLARCNRLDLRKVGSYKSGPLRTRVHDITNPAATDGRKIAEKVWAPIPATKLSEGQSVHFRFRVAEISSRLTQLARAFAPADALLLSHLEKDSMVLMT